MGGEVDTTALIIAICVIVPAVIAIGVCAIIYFAHRKKDRKFQRQTISSSSYEYGHSRERFPVNNYTIDLARANRYQPATISHIPPSSRRSREPPPVFEQSPPSYDVSVIQTRRPAVMPQFSSVRTIPSSSTNQVRRSPPGITSSVYATMPPSYAEIFLTSNHFSTS